jgi:hypothetical protein
MGTEMVEVFGTTKRETDDAVLIEFADGEIWLPKSQLEDWPDIEEEGEVIIPYWLAMDKDLI